MNQGDNFMSHPNDISPGLLDNRPTWFRNLRTNSKARIPSIIQSLPSSFPIHLGAAVYTTSDICPGCHMPIGFHIRRNNAQDCFMVLEKRGDIFYHPGQDKPQNPGYIARAFSEGRGKPILLVAYRAPKVSVSNQEFRVSRNAGRGNILANFDNDEAPSASLSAAMDAFFALMFKVVA